MRDLHTKLWCVSKHIREAIPHYLYIYTHAAYVEKAFIALCGRLPFSRNGRLISFAIYKRDKCDGAHTTVYIMPIPVYTDGAFMCEP